MPGAGDIAQRVLRWRRQFGRQGLPWQDTKDPYRVWLSEIMLQQTQVATVRDYYARFLQRFPDLRSLADAPLDDVLALWSGLGYYSRARNLHRCAQVVQREHGGVFPERSAAWRTCPASAVPPPRRSPPSASASASPSSTATSSACSAGRSVLPATCRSPAEERALWQQAQDLVPARGVAHYTQGLMDLGATLCSARNPACERCPLATLCVAHREGRPEAYPVKTRRLRRGARTHAWLWLAQGDRLWLVQRPDQGVWAGLWSLPEFDTPAALQRLLHDWPGRGETLPTIEHALTHFDWTLQPLRWQLPARLSAKRLAELTAQLPQPSQGRWVDLDQALQMGLPAPLRKLLSR